MARNNFKEAYDYECLHVEFQRKYYEEINSIIEEQGKIEVNCDFCNAHYAFDKIDATQLMVTEVAVTTSPKIH